MIVLIVDSLLISTFLYFDLPISLLGILISASLIIWQIDKQHRNNFELQKENSREKLKLEIYTEYSKTIYDASNKTILANSSASAIVMNFNFFVDQISKGRTPLPISKREPIFRETHFAAIDSITALLFALEKYEIINPNLEIFRTAFSYAQSCMSEAYNPFQTVLLEFLPQDVPLQEQVKLGTDVIIPKSPSKEDFQRILEVAQPYIDATMEVISYTSDLSKEAQHIFLGNLFCHRIPPRKPIDPKYVVISTEPKEVVKLKKYFLEETEWGKEQKRVNDEVHQSVKKEQCEDV